jgi:hypothetical protein
MKKKRMLFISFALAAVLVAGPMAFSIGATGDNGGMNKMMEAMNSPEGQEMMNSCSNFMSSYSESK